MHGQHLLTCVPLCATSSSSSRAVPVLFPARVATVPRALGSDVSVMIEESVVHPFWILFLTLFWL